MMDSNPRIATYGFEPDLLASLNRTGRAFRKALKSGFQLIDTNPERGFVDASLLFSDAAGPVIVKSRAPLVIPLHGGAVASSREVEKTLKRLRKCDRLIVNCTADLAVLEKYLENPTQTAHLVQLPVDSQVFKPMNKAIARQMLRISEDKYVVGFVGRLIPQKGIHYFLNVVSECRRYFPHKEIIALIVGDYQSGYPLMEFVNPADYRNHISNLMQTLGLEESVLLLGSQVDDEALRVIYNAMDVYVHLTHTVDENFGYAPLEAMACGIPVIATAYGGLRDSVRHRETGFLVDTWTSSGGLRSDFAQAIRFINQLIEDTDYIHAMGARARMYAESHFSWERFQSTLHTVVHDAISSSQRQEHLKVLSPIETTVRSFLPRTQPDWADIFRATETYALGLPTLSADSYLCWTHDLFRLRRAVYRSSDPAWPAEYSVSDTECSIIDECQYSKKVSEVIDKFGQDIPQSLLKKGILSLRRSC